MSVSHVCHVYVTRVSRLLHVVCAECAYSVRAMGVQCVCGVLHVCSVTRVCVQRVQCLQSHVCGVCTGCAMCVQGACTVCSLCAMCVQCVCNGCVMCAVGVQRVQRVGNVSNKCSGFTVRGVCATGVQWVCTGGAVGMHRARWCVWSMQGVCRGHSGCARGVWCVQWVCSGCALGLHRGSCVCRGVQHVQ